MTIHYDPHVADDTHWQENNHLQVVSGNITILGQVSTDILVEQSDDAASVTAHFAVAF